MSIGFLSTSLLKSVWMQYSEQERQQLLQLLQRFDLIYYMRGMTLVSDNCIESIEGVGIGGGREPTYGLPYGPQTDLSQTLDDSGGTDGNGLRQPNILPSLAVNEGDGDGGRSSAEDSQGNDPGVDSEDGEDEGDENATELDKRRKEKWIAKNQDGAGWMGAGAGVGNQQQSSGKNECKRGDLILIPRLGKECTNS